MDERKIVFLLEHVRKKEDGEDDFKTIGIYSSRAAAELAIQRLRRQPGFRDAPDGFVLDPYEMDVDSWEEGFITLFGDGGL